MNIPCPVCVPCLDPSDPFQNFTTEDPDVNHSFCYGSGNGSLLPGAGRNWNVAGCNIVWGPVSCFALADEDCQACVETSRWTCLPPNWPNPEVPDTPVDPNQSPIDNPNGGPGAPPDSPPTHRGVFFNFAASCNATCPDGSIFTFTVRPARFYAWSQLQADAEAATYACQQARRHKVCMSALSPSEACINDAYTGQITATGRFLSLTVNTWQIVGGSLPAGLELNGGSPLGGKSVSITGTPTTAGTYNFEVRVTGPNGDFMQKAYALCVIAISPDALPDATLGVAYSETLTATPCASPALSWQLFSGALPDGLTLDEQTGVISGTPTIAGTFNFVIVLQTEAT